MKRIVIVILMSILICTGCGNAENINVTQVQKENVVDMADISEEIPQESTDISTTYEESKEKDNTNVSIVGEDGMRENVMDENNKLEQRLHTPLIYEITNGNTGIKVTLNELQQVEQMGTLLENMIFEEEYSIQRDAEKPVGYLYCIRMLNENGDVSQTITLNGSYIKIDNQYYIVKMAEELLTYLDGLYECL